MSALELLHQLTRLPRLTVEQGYRLACPGKCPFHDNKMLVRLSWAGWRHHSTVPFGLN